ncbi:MAG: ankyrin repeat domain-containing protein [Blastocatellia bacterium]|nr:ankyrin repeat domain-containing protein [Blastocatellia bacterium]MBL8194830.1 ankyrin repeat domain-containing protein [Blastocatellia bacterium]MBN8725287.1 ankyrin repeat domain-containing protein [Acidobacteriota bacterium]
MQVKSFLILSLVLSLNLMACKNQDPGGTTTVSTPTPTPTFKMPEVDEIKENTYERFSKATEDSEYLKLVERGEIEWVKDILSKKETNVNERDKGNRSALIIAAKEGYIDLSKVLLEAKIDVNLQDVAGNTALMHAVSRNNKELVDLLLENKADVNIVDSMGISPLMKAAGNGRNDLVEKLLTKGANAKGKAKNGWTVLQFAEPYPETIAMLKKAGAK